MNQPLTSDDLRASIAALNALAQELFEAQFELLGGRKPADPTWDDLDDAERDDFRDQARRMEHVLGAARACVGRPDALEIAHRVARPARRVVTGGVAENPAPNPVDVVTELANSVLRRRPPKPGTGGDTGGSDYLTRADLWAIADQLGPVMGR